MKAALSFFFLVILMASFFEGCGAGISFTGRSKSSTLAGGVSSSSSSGQTLIFSTSGGASLISSDMYRVYLMVEPSSSQGATSSSFDVSDPLLEGASVRILESLSTP